MDEFKALAEKLTGVTIPTEKQNHMYQWNGDRKAGWFSFSVSDLNWEFRLKGGFLLAESKNLSKHTGCQLHRAVEFVKPNMVLTYRLCSAMLGSDYECYIVAQGQFTDDTIHHCAQIDDAMSAVKARGN